MTATAKAKKEYAGKVPFEDGNMLDYVWDDADPKVVWKQNHKFKAKMVFVAWIRGRSAVRIMMREASAPKGQGRFYMFMRDFEDLVKNTNLLFGETPLLEWTFVKRGANYGMKMVLP